MVKRLSEFQSCATTAFADVIAVARDDSSLGPVRSRRRNVRAPMRGRKEEKTAEQLDKELDAFMGDEATNGNGDVEMGI